MPSETYISFYLRTSRIHVFRQTITEIGNPQFIRFRVREDGKSMVMEAYPKKDFQSHRVPKKGSKGLQMEIHSLPLCRLIMNQLGWEEGMSYRIPGKAYPAQQVAVFDLMAAGRIKGSEKKRDNT